MTKFRNLYSFGSACFAAAVLLSSPGRAADHGDGPSSSNDPSADIGDVYAFLDPNDNTKVIVAMTTRGFIAAGENANMGIFDPSIVYRLVLETTGDAVPDASISVTFSPKTSAAAGQTATVQMLKGATSVFSFTAPATAANTGAAAVDQVVTTNAASGVSFFAGLADDPFFFDIPAFGRFIASVGAGAPNAGVFNRGRDSFAGYNTLSIVLSVPKALFGVTNNSLGVYGTVQRASRHFDPNVINISTRGRVDSGQNVLIAGFAVSGTSAKQVLIRGVGPTLSQFGVTGALTDPKVDVYNAAGQNIGSNNDWAASLSTTFSQAGAFALTNGSKDAALVLTLQPGNYSVQLTSNDGTPGIGLTEVYDLSANIPPGGIDFGALNTVDRMGVPAVNVALIPFAKKDAYNLGTPTEDAAGKFAGDIVATLKSLGTNDTNIGILASVAVTNGDYLRLNFNTANSGTGGGNNAGAGFPNGRRFGDDVIDTLLFFIANQNALGDNVNANDVPLQNTFPFIAKAQQPRDAGVDDNTRN